MNRPCAATLVAAALLAAGSAGCSRRAEAASAPPRPVRAVELQLASVDNLSHFSGTLEPRASVELHFKVGGRVALIGAGEAGRPVEEGDAIAQGQELAALELDDLERNRKAAAATLLSAQAQVRAARAQLRQAEAEAKRARMLFSSNTLPKSELERADSAVAAAMANLDAALGQQLARSQQYQLAKAARTDARLTSPIAGTLARRTVEVGEVAAPGRPAFTIIDERQMRVVFAVPDTRVSRLHIGDQVTVTLEALPGRVLPANVTKIVPIADPQMRSFTVEVALDNADGALRAGMVASVSLSEGARAQSVLVPIASIVRDPEAGADRKYAVFVVAEGGSHVALRPVALGELHANSVEVREGLAAGERVVVEGAQLLRPGEAVEVVP